MKNREESVKNGLIVYDSPEAIKKQCLSCHENAHAKPFDFDYFSNGGIAGLSGGDKSGPPPERGPNPQGLLSLMKRGMKI